MSYNPSISEVRDQLEELLLEARMLDTQIEQSNHDPHADQLQIYRYRKRRQQISVIITRLESQLIPDLDA